MNCVFVLRGTGYFKLILSRHLTWLDPNYLQILKCQSLNFLRPVNFVKTNSFTGEIWREGRVTSRLRALAQQMTERPESWVRHTREDDGALCRAEQTTAGAPADTSGRAAFVVSQHETSNTAQWDPGSQIHHDKPGPSWSMTANKPNCSNRVNPITVTFSHNIFQPGNFTILTFKNIFFISIITLLQK